MRLALFIALFGVSCAGQDSQLTALKATLASLREHRSEHSEVRGASSQLTVAKHQLRNFIESRLFALPEDGDFVRLGRELNDSLKQAGLFCDDSCDQNELGSVTGVQILREQNALILIAGVGIDVCGVDDSAYIYEWNGKRWRRIWESEQNVYTVKGYQPQSLNTVHVSDVSRKDRTRLVLTLGTFPWCTSVWRRVYYRVWRINPDEAVAHPLIQASEMADVSEPMTAAVTSTDVLVEFVVIQTKVDVAFRRKAIRHYTVAGNVARQIDPIALSPHDFVDEWLTDPWPQSAKRSESPLLRSQHEKFPGGDSNPTMHCVSRRDLWEVGVTVSDPPYDVYFLVRWKRPFHFTMVAVNHRPSPDCTEESTQADFPQTLFPAKK